MALSPYLRPEILVSALLVFCVVVTSPLALCFGDDYFLCTRQGVIAFDPTAFRYFLVKGRDYNIFCRIRFNFL